MIELAGVRYGVGRRTAGATACLAVVAGVSYSLFIARFALPWFEVHSPGVLRLTESIWAVCAMTSLLIATAVFCSIARAPKERIATSVGDAETPGRSRGPRLISDVWALLDVVPLSMGLAISVLTRVDGWSSSWAVFNVTMCATGLLMAAHVGTLWRLAQSMRETRDSGCMTRVGYPRRTRRSKRSAIAVAVGTVSFVVLPALYTLQRAVAATAHNLTHMTDHSQAAGPDFLHLCALSSGGVVLLMLAIAFHARGV